MAAARFLSDAGSFSEREEFDVNKTVCPFCRKELEKQQTVVQFGAEYDVYKCPACHMRFALHWHKTGEPTRTTAAQAA